MKIEKIFSRLPMLETERLILRKITLEDIEEMYSYCSNEEVSMYGHGIPHNSLVETKESIDRILSQWEDKKLVTLGDSI